MKHHPSHHVTHPAPWDACTSLKPAEKAHGPRNLPQVMLEVNKKPDRKAYYKQGNTEYYYASTGEHGLHTGYSRPDTNRVVTARTPKRTEWEGSIGSDIYTSTTPVGLKVSDKRNGWVETGHVDPEPHKNPRRMVNHPAEQCSIPFQGAEGTVTYLTTDYNKGGRKHNDHDNTEQLGNKSYVADTKVHKKPLRKKGEVISVEARNNVVFERQTGVRRSKSLYEPERAPFGTDYNYDYNIPIRWRHHHHGHVDTRGVIAGRGATAGDLAF